MISDIKAKVNQVSPSLLSDGDMDYPAQSKLGQLFVADWKTRLLLAGALFRIDVGGITAGGNVAVVVGGGAGTTVDEDQPELGIGVPVGYYLIPIRIWCSLYQDMDADGDISTIVAFADRAAAVPTDGTKTAVTPLNLLDGGPSFPGTAFKECTADLTDPTVSEILDYVSCQASQITAASTIVTPLIRMVYEPSVPEILAGPCSVYLCWGGTAKAANGMGGMVVACVSSSWFPVS